VTYSNASRQAAQQVLGSSRYGYSCGRCGEWFFADFIKNARLVELACPVCDGKLFWRGRVVGTSVLGDAVAPVCNDQCVSAKGVNCDCKCLGMNHGSVRWVTVTYEAGQATLDVADVELMARLRASRLPKLAEAEALEAQLDEVLRAHFADTIAKRRAGGWMAGPDFARLLSYQNHQAAMRHARSLKTPEGRLRALKRLGADLEALALTS
jgi:DNA-directed RNA polymerase subunit RPC12/RpoP